MTVADVIINMVCYKNVSITTGKQSEKIFDGIGYPRSYGFIKNKEEGYWIEEFIEPTSSYDKMEDYDIREFNKYRLRDIKHHINERLIKLKLI